MKEIWKCIASRMWGGTLDFEFSAHGSDRISVISDVLKQFLESGYNPHCISGIWELEMFLETTIEVDGKEIKFASETIKSERLDKNLLTPDNYPVIKEFLAREQAKKSGRSSTPSKGNSRLTNESL